MSVTGLAFADASAGATPADDTAARRAVVALMLTGIALDAFVAPAAAVVAVPARLALHASDALSATTAIAFTTGYDVAIVLSLWASARLGKKRYVTLTFFGFALASLGCAVAPDGIAFAFARALQGLTLGGVFATCLLTFAATAPKRDLGAVFAIFAFLALATPNAAPLLTGLLIAGGGWRAVFLVFAFVALAIGMAVVRLMRDPSPAKPRPFDGISALALVLMFGSFATFAERGSATAFADPSAILALLLALGAGVVFVVRLRIAPAPFVDLGIFSNRIVARGVSISLLLGIIIASGEIQLQYARVVLHLEGGHASGVLALRIAGVALGGLLATVFGARGVSGRSLVGCGFAVLAAAFVVQGATTALSLGEGLLSFVMLVQGIGFALVMGPLGSLLFAAVPPTSMAALVVVFKLAVGIGDAFAAPLVAAFLAVEAFAGRIPAWAYADVWAASALVAALAARSSRSLSTTSA